MSRVYEFETFVQIRHNQALTYDLPKGGFEQPTWKKPPKRKGYSGEITASTKKRIETAIDVFLQLSTPRRIFNPVTNRHQNFQLSFITLTISRPEPVTTEDGHAALKVWLQHFRRPWHKRKMSEKMSTYIWKAELQERGQLHYHLTTNSFLHLIEIRRVWNDIQKARGWLDSYNKAFGKWDANSTDVHSVKKIKDIRRYLSKYISKQQYRPSAADPEAGYPLMCPVLLDGKVWGCSEDLKGKKRFSAKMDESTWGNLCDAYGKGEIKHHAAERCDFYDLEKPTNLLSAKLHSDYLKWKS